MTTERLYYDDSYLRSFMARVTQHRMRDNRPAVALDRSAFYPESGGQAADHGTLNGVAVLDTQADDAGNVWHILAAPLDAETVRGEIDWVRRWDMMQQHLGQHLLSAACEELFEARTLSVHLGDETCTLDLDRADLSAEQLAEIETRANEMIWANVEVLARFVTPEQLAVLPLRKPPKAYDRIRVVSAGDFDHSPCGGTHPRRTGEIGSIVLRRTERYKSGLRVEFVCGDRALRDYRQKNRLLLSITADLGVGLAELPAAIGRLRAAEERQRKALDQAQERLAGYEAAELLAATESVGGTPIVVRAFDDRSLDALRTLGREIAGRGGVALLGLRADKAQLVFTRGAGNADMGALLRVAAPIVGGRGGGRPEAAQGGGPLIDRLDEALRAARAALDT